MKCLLFIVCALFAFQIQAQTKKTTISFEDQLIKGNKTNPDILLSRGKYGSHFKKLVKLRENFLPELRQSGINDKSVAKKVKK